MKLKNILFNAIPFAGYIKMKNKKDVSFLEVLGHSTYMTILGLGAFFFLTQYGINIFTKKDFNPINAVKNLEKVYGGIVLEKRLYPEKYSQIFGPNGFADRNKDNIIDFPERVEAYRIMGFFQDVLPIAGETNFPKPTLNQLEKAVRSYEEERK